LVDPKFTRAYYPPPQTTFLKRPSLLGYSPGDVYYDQVLNEIAACEILRQHPHPNIAPYFGCVVKDGRIRGLVFKRYHTTLGEMLNKKKTFDRVGCLRGIRAGVRHMHRLGLVHNDLNPANIMMDHGKPVIIDFDSCKREGDKLDKGGSPLWALDNPEWRSRRENDVYGLNKLRKALFRIGRY
jgi:serine/threonine protein kinase